VGCNYRSYLNPFPFPFDITEAPSPSPSSRKDKADGKKSKLRNPLRGDARVQSYTGDEKLFKPAKLTDIKRMKSTHMDRKLSQSHKATRRSVIVESRNLFAPTAPLPMPKIPSGTSSTTSLKELPPLPVPNTQTDEQEEEEIPESQTLADMHSLGNEAAITLDDIPQIAARTGDYQSGIYFSDLSSFQHLIVRHIAVVKIEPHVKDVFTMEELLDMIESKKASLWDKFMTSFKQGNKNRVKEMGTFGVSFEALVERNGADSNIGARPSTVRIPTFIEDSILAMRQMGKFLAVLLPRPSLTLNSPNFFFKPHSIDMSVEGVFRKNGNIRRLKELSEIIDRDPSEAMLANENPIQVAALLKKFLREMPEPLLTFKLHRLIIFSQSKFFLGCISGFLRMT
jgi:hypothetical protein